MSTTKMTNLMDIRHETFTKAGIKITQLKDKLIGEQSVEGLSAAEILEKI